MGKLSKRIRELEERIRRLEVLVKRTRLDQSVSVEEKVAALVGGTTTEYAEPYDVVSANGCRIEVKYSKVNQPRAKTRTLRWNWSKPLGQGDRGNDYDYLLLVGERHPTLTDQYGDRFAEFVYFLVPRDRVLEIATKGGAGGASIGLNIDKSSVTADRPRLLWRFRVKERKLTNKLGRARYNGGES